MTDWFTLDQIDPDTSILSEYRHWEETHCYLLNGSERSLLIDVYKRQPESSPVRFFRILGNFHKKTRPVTVAAQMSAMGSAR